MSSVTDPVTSGDGDRRRYKWAASPSILIGMTRTITRSALPVLALLLAAACTRLTPEQQLAQDVANALGGVDRVKAARLLTLEGTGRQFNLGQDLRPGLADQTFAVSGYTREIDLSQHRMRTTLTRTPTFAYFQGPQAQTQVQGRRWRPRLRRRRSGEAHARLGRRGGRPPGRALPPSTGRRLGPCCRRRADHGHPHVGVRAPHRRGYRRRAADDGRGRRRAPHPHRDAGRASEPRRRRDDHHLQRLPGGQRPAVADAPLRPRWTTSRPANTPSPRAPPRPALRKRPRTSPRRQSRRRRR